MIAHTGTPLEGDNLGRRPAAYDVEVDVRAAGADGRKNLVTEIEEGIHVWPVVVRTEEEQIPPRLAFAWRRREVVDVPGPVAGVTRRR